MNNGINAMVLSERDNIAVALIEFKAGNSAIYDSGKKFKEVVLENDVPLYHKFSLVEIKEGEPVYKYGQVIGQATRDIKMGQHVHCHNMESFRKEIGEKVESNNL